MTYLHWIQVLGSLGIFLFSLRFLSNVLQQSIAKWMRPWLERFLATPIRCLFSGVAATSVLQASSISIMATMGLLHHNLLTLEQAFLVMLGATVGTTLKVWFFTESMYLYTGFTLLAFSSLALLFVRQRFWREWLDLCTAIGFIFIGISLLAEALKGVLTQPFLQEYLLHTSNLPGGMSQLMNVMAGFVVAVALQSSSTTVFLILTLASFLSLPAGAALILGANIGTTITILVVSIEYGKNVQRLALAHFLVKSMGVAITLFFFPYFLSGVGLLTSWIPGDAMVVQLAGVHIIFNLINMVWWAVFDSFFITFVCWLIPGKRHDTWYSLDPVVRKMLIGSPQRALQEAQRQLADIQTITKSLMDYCLELMHQDWSVKPALNQDPTFEIDRFVAVKEGILELLLQLQRRHALEPLQTHQVRAYLHFLGDCENLYRHLADFRQHLESGIVTHLYQFPGDVWVYVSALQKQINTLWLAIILKNEIPQDCTAEAQLFHDIEQAYWLFLKQEDKLRQAYGSWVYESLGYLRHLTENLRLLYADAEAVIPEPIAEQAN